MTSPDESLTVTEVAVSGCIDISTASQAWKESTTPVTPVELRMRAGEGSLKNRLDQKEASSLCEPNESSPISKTHHMQLPVLCVIPKTRPSPVTTTSCSWGSFASPMPPTRHHAAKSSCSPP